MRVDKLLKINIEKLTDEILEDFNNYYPGDTETDFEVYKEEYEVRVGFSVEWRPDGYENFDDDEKIRAFEKVGGWDAVFSAIAKDWRLRKHLKEEVARQLKEHFRYLRIRPLKY